MIDQIKKMTVTELAELIKAIETEFGVSAAAPVAASSAVAAVPTEAAAEKAEFKVTLKEAGSEKIKVIKALREAATALGKTIGLKEAKDMVEGAPATVFESVPKDEAKKMKDALEAAGAKVELS
jgi:large subunit ribosomal protein L7/L12